MIFFNSFRKKEKQPRTTDNGVNGPTFLDGLTEHISEPSDLQKHEWRRTLKATSGHKKFRIMYFGKLHPEHQHLIVGEDSRPALIVAIEPNSGQEILLFDGCAHGYNAMFCDNFSSEQKQSRKPDKMYKLVDGTDTFELTIATYHGIDYDDEFASEVDKNGLIEIIDGSRIEFATVKRNGFDTLQILGKTDNGDVIEIVSEELA